MALTAAPGSYPQIETGRALLQGKVRSRMDLPMLYVARYGVIVEGPDPHDFLRPSTIGDLRSAVTAVLQPWIAQRSDPDWLAWLRVGGQPIDVLTLCRLLYLISP